MACNDCDSYAAINVSETVKTAAKAINKYTHIRDNACSRPPLSLQQAVDIREAAEVCSYTYLLCHNDEFLPHISIYVG